MQLTRLMAAIIQHVGLVVGLPACDVAQPVVALSDDEGVQHRLRMSGGILAACGLGGNCYTLAHVTSGCQAGLAAGDAGANGLDVGTGCLRAAKHATRGGTLPG